MRKLIILLVSALLIQTAALAQVVATGNVNMRDLPGLDGNVIFTVAAGELMDYLDEKSTDDRGVDWLHVEYAGIQGWVSSKYAEDAQGYIDMKESQLPKAQIPAGATLEDLMVYDPIAGEDYIELTGFYCAPLADTAALLELGNFEELPSEAPNRYSNEALMLAGYDTAECMVLTGAGYKIFGAAIGMHDDAVRALMTAAGMVYAMTSGNVLVYEHPAPEGHPIFDDFDSCLNLYFEGEVLVEIGWNSYTG